MASIQIPTMLRPYTDGQRTVPVDAATLQDALDALAQHYPEAAARVLRSDGRLSPAVHVFVGDQDQRQLAGLQTPLSDDEVVLIVPAMAGGS